MLAGCSSSCGFQICSEKCQKLHIRHTAKECQYIKKIADKSADQWLTVLRVLMIRQEDSDLFDNFMLLEDHLQDRKDCLIMKLKSHETDRMWLVTGLQSQCPDKCLQTIFKSIARSVIFPSTTTSKCSPTPSNVDKMFHQY